MIEQFKKSQRPINISDNQENVFLKKELWSTFLENYSK